MIRYNRILRAFAIQGALLLGMCLLVPTAGAHKQSATAGAHQQSATTGAHLQAATAGAQLQSATAGTQLQPASQEAEAESRHGFTALVFSRTTGFRHASIGAGVTAVTELGTEHDFDVTATEDASVFTPESLAAFDVVIFLNTTGDVLDQGQQDALEAWIAGGGGFVGIHSAADTEYDWPFYGELVGAWFESHPPGTPTAEVKVVDRVHPSTAGLPDVWTRTDEWYNYQTNPRGRVHVLATLDESTYDGGTMGADHPIAWCQPVGGGRSFYTAGGHTSGAYSEPLFRDHLLGGIEWAAGAVEGDCSATLGASFERVILRDGLDNPMQLAVTPDLDVIVVQREGEIRIIDAGSGVTTTAGDLDVITANEDGLLGIALDPEFAINNWLYLFYSPSGPEAIQRVSRFTLPGSGSGRVLDMSSEEVLLEISVQRAQCCHSAGALAFGPDGNLYISTGDNTNPFESSGYAPIDERPGRSAWDAQKSSGNTADLRGKILRITPQPDGTYTVPSGNLFTSEADGAPEIYTMGLRNPFRISIDQETGWLYWGDVGPDASGDSPTRGTRGYDEFNQAKSAGNYGWPYCVGDNQAYRDYDFGTGVSGDLFDCSAPVNDSPNNTGALYLPPARPAWIWYPYGLSDEFPSLADGTGRTAAAGPVYHFDPPVGGDPAAGDTRYLPAYYDGSLFIYEWARSWIHEVKMDDSGNIVDIMPFLPDLELLRPIDLKVGPDGALYLLEWGTGFGGNNPDARLSRIEFSRGSRSPVLAADATPTSGPAPLTVMFSTADTYDPDPADELVFSWDFDGDGSADSSDPSPTHVYDTNGSYTASVIVTDPLGNSATASFDIVVGNSAPSLILAAPAQGGFFHWGEPVPFELSVTDPEDGSTEDGSIDCGDVVIQLYLGHDEHAHPLEQISGCSGTFEIPGADHGDPAARLFFLLDATHTDQGAGMADPLSVTVQHVLQPVRIEAEHYSSQQGVQLETAGDDLGGGLNIAFIDHGDAITIEDVNLTGMTGMTFRAASAGTGGTITVRDGGVAGRAIGSVRISPTGGWQDYDDFTMRIDGESGLTDLTFLFENDPDDTGLFNVNWIDFHGAGVHSERPVRGFRAQYFNATDLSGRSVDVVDPQISFFWGSDAPAPLIANTTWSVRWDGTLTPEVTDSYRFHARSDDGMRVLLDGSVILDTWNSPGGSRSASSDEFELEAGSQHGLTVEYFNEIGAGFARLEWSGSTFTRRTLPSDAVRPSEGTSSEHVGDDLPGDIALVALYPQPVQTRSTLAYDLPSREQVRIDIHDALGRRVHRLVDDWRDAGRHRTTVDTAHLASGVYLLQMTAGSSRVTRQIVVLR